MLKLGNTTAKTNPEKAQLFAESVERNFGIESHLFRKSHFDRINKFVEAHSYHFTPLDSLNDITTDTDGDKNYVLKQTNIYDNHARSRNSDRLSF